MADLDTQIIVAAAALKIQNMIREGARDLGDILKSMGVNSREVQLRALEIYGAAIEVLKTKAQQATKRK